MLNSHAESTALHSGDRVIADEIANLAAKASVEINVGDEKHLAESATLLPPSTRIYVSHMPKQRWEATASTCEAVRRAGLEPVPHIPVRLLESNEQFATVLDMLQTTSGASEVLLISGDYPEATGPFSTVAQALDTNILGKYGFQGVSIAGHPEGHPRVALNDIREAEAAKIRLARQLGLESRLVTQFLFESTPFIDWVNSHRRNELDTRFVCGLAGPAKIATLARYAMRCGVGPSVRALGAQHGILKHLLGDHGPDRMLKQLAEVRVEGRCHFDGIHMFCFGGFLRTAQWLHSVATRDFRFNNSGGFDI